MGLAEAFQVNVSGLCQDAFSDIKQAAPTASQPENRPPIADDADALHLKMVPLSIEDDDDPLQLLQPQQSVTQILLVCSVHCVAQSKFTRNANHHYYRHGQGQCHQSSVWCNQRNENNQKVNGSWNYSQMHSPSLASNAFPITSLAASWNLCPSSSYACAASVMFAFVFWFLGLFVSCLCFVGPCFCK